jgi:hypothetical protein
VAGVSGERHEAREAKAKCIDSGEQACYFFNGAEFFCEKKSIWTVTQQNGVRS